jgi:hypothetical protein
MSRTPLSLDQESMQPEFAILIANLWKQAKNHDKSYPLETARLAAARKAGEVPFLRKTEDRIFRKLDWLLRNGFADIQINRKKIESKHPKFYSAYRSVIENEEEEGQRILDFISGKQKVDFEVFETVDEMYTHLKEKLFEEMERPKTKILVSHGSTFSALKDTMLKDKSGISHIRGLKERVGDTTPIFLPACGSYSAASSVAGDIYQYLIEESACATSKQLNDSIGLDSYYLDTPATFSHIIPNNALPNVSTFKKFSNSLKASNNPLWVLREFYKSSPIYRKIYSEPDNKLSRDVETILVTFGSSMELDLKLNYTKHLKELDPILGDAIGKANQEVLLRFHRNGVPLVDTLKTISSEKDIRKRQQAISERKALFAFQFSYLGVKESDCAALAERHRNGAKGMGTIIVVNHHAKIAAVLLSITGKKAIANKVLLPANLLPHVVKALEQLPSLKEKYEKRKK